MLDTEKLVKDSYYINSNVIEFLIIENLALKSLLHEKGIVDPEEYKKHQIQAAQLVEKRVSDQIEQYKKNNSKIFDVLNNLEQKNKISQTSA
jgi:hypothetical protein